MEKDNIKLREDELELIFTLYDGMNYETILKTIFEKREMVKKEIEQVNNKNIISKITSQYTVEELIKKKNYELIDICKEMGITGYWVNDKIKLIQLIINK